MVIGTVDDSIELLVKLAVSEVLIDVLMEQGGIEGIETVTKAVKEIKKVMRKAVKEELAKELRKNKITLAKNT